MNTQSFSEALQQWFTFACLNKKPKTVKFYREVYGLIIRDWPDMQMPVESITKDVLLAFATKSGHHCPSRWNTMVAAFRYITPLGRMLPRRPLRMRKFVPPNQTEFSKFLFECDRMTRTKAGLVVRFLSYTGLRIGEAQSLRERRD